MNSSSQLLLTFLLNAIWQIALIAALALFCDWLLRDAKALHRHLLWTAALFLSLILPLLSSVGSRAPLPVQDPVPLVRHEGRSVASRSSTSDALALPAVTLPATTPDSLELASTERQSVSSIPISRRVAAILIALYALFIAYRSLRLVRAWHSARTVARNAYTAPFSSRVAKVIQKCLDRTGVSGVSILGSNSIQVPVTVGSVKPLIIVPEQLLYEDDDNLLTAAIGHEMVHILRRDYSRNLINELIYLPISFHPAAALLRRRINRTREMRCDEVVAERLMEPNIYARSLVQLATGALPANSHTTSVMVGIGDADMLEERVMTILNRPKRTNVRNGWLLLAASICLAVPGVAAVPFAVHISLEQTPAITSSSGGSQSSGVLNNRTTWTVTQVKKENEKEKEKQEQEREKVKHVTFQAQEGEKVTHVTFIDGSDQKEQRRIREIKVQEQQVREVEAKMQKLRGEEERLAQEVKAAGERLSREQMQEVEMRMKEMVLERQRLERGLTKKELEAWHLENTVKAKDRFELAKKASVTMPQAIQIALGQVHGSVLESRLLREHNDSAAYHITIIYEAGNEIHTTSVFVSAVDGTILRIK